MLQALKNERNWTTTENGAVTHMSTLSHCVDLFATIGAIRTASEQEIVNRFVRAFAEDSDTAMKLLFFGRDVRGGLGERRVFRIIIRHLAHTCPQVLRKNIPLIPEYGRFDDLMVLLDTPCEADVMEVIRTQLRKDMDSTGEVSLLAKWLPSVNASSRNTVRQARHLARALGMTEADYRKTLVALRKRIHIIEDQLRRRDYTFDYAQQPSRAMFQYRRAFLRNDGPRYRAFLQAVAAGEKKLHADTLAPYELVRAALDARGENFNHQMDAGQRAALDAAWEALPHWGDGSNALAVIDTSGSMYYEDNALPAAVALSLGIYVAKHNTGMFHGHFMEFSSQPQLLKLQGETFTQQLEYLCTFNKIADTNVEAVFDVILEAAVRNHLPQQQMPETLYLISDMEFNCCVHNASLTNFENAKRNYAAHGYQLPRIVFWNVASRNSNQPVTQNEEGVALVSGCTPRLFSMVAGGKISPYLVMMDILHSERYAPISA